MLALCQSDVEVAKSRASVLTVLQRQQCLLVYNSPGGVNYVAVVIGMAGRLFTLMTMRLVLRCAGRATGIGAIMDARLMGDGLGAC